VKHVFKSLLGIEVMLDLEGSSFLNTSVAILSSNISAAIPITPNGMGLSEFVFSKILSTVSGESRMDLYGTSYLIYRVFNMVGHLSTYLATVLEESSRASYSLGN
jgi:hypothetical protein